MAGRESIAKTLLKPPSHQRPIMFLMFGCSPAFPRGLLKFSFAASIIGSPAFFIRFAIQPTPAKQSSLDAMLHSVWRSAADPNLNHLFQNCETGALNEYSKIEETMALEALDLMLGWLQKRFVEAPHGD